MRICSIIFVFAFLSLSLLPTTISANDDESKSETSKPEECTVKECSDKEQQTTKICYYNRVGTATQADFQVNPHWPASRGGNNCVIL